MLLLLGPAALLRAGGLPWWAWILGGLAWDTGKEFGSPESVNRLLAWVCALTIVVVGAHSTRVQLLASETRKLGLVVDIILMPAVSACLCLRSATKLAELKRWSSTGDLNLVGLYESWALSSLFTLFAQVALGSSGGLERLGVDQFVLLNACLSIYEYGLKDWAPCELCWRYVSSSCYDLWDLHQRPVIEAVNFASSCLALMCIGRLEVAQHKRLEPAKPFLKFLSAKAMMSVLFMQPLGLELMNQYLPIEVEDLNLYLIVLESLPLAIFNLTAYPPADFTPGGALAHNADLGEIDRTEKALPPRQRGRRCVLGCRQVRQRKTSEASSHDMRVAPAAPKPLKTVQRLQTLLFWVIFAAVVFGLQSANAATALNRGDGTCGRVLPQIKHATPDLRDVDAEESDDGYYHCDSVRYRCDEGFYGNPYIVCTAEGQWRVYPEGPKGSGESTQCVGHPTKRGCACKAAWEHCGKFGYWECKEYHGCARPPSMWDNLQVSGVSEPWCKTHGSCSVEWDYCTVPTPQNVSDVVPIVAQAQRSSDSLDAVLSKASGHLKNLQNLHMR
jgi:hypothetical protein